MLTEITIGVVGGKEVDTWRGIAMSVLQRLQHLVLFELQEPQQRGGVALTCWDYHLDAPEVLPDGTLPERSLAMVDRSEGLIAIFGDRLPPITKQEVWRAFEKRSRKLPQQVWIYFDPTEKPAELDSFFLDIKREFGEEPRYSRFDDELDFQGKVFTTMIPFLLRHSANPFSIQREGY